MTLYSKVSQKGVCPAPKGEANPERLPVVGLRLRGGGSEISHARGLQEATQVTHMGSPLLSCGYNEPSVGKHHYVVTKGSSRWTRKAMPSVS